MKAHSAIVFLLVFCAMAAPYNGAEAAAPSPIRATTGQTFGSEEEAVAVLIDALRADNPEALRTVLGQAARSCSAPATSIPTRQSGRNF